ncbi:hypothetical protein RND71_025307 [Anisodus tanguticus]|uniref:Uncharacterized protein n=1 Tax=Anisodus tanguticus TaxID=243964 RepID=A0AAE1VA96_9SOLA|nr:hypothetical protein RND71_025307 [Anisodus tanguticus]
MLRKYLHDPSHVIQPQEIVLNEELQYEETPVTMSNGIANVTLSIPDGLITSISYGRIDNLLATQNVETTEGNLETYLLF